MTTDITEMELIFNSHFSWFWYHMNTSSETGVLSGMLYEACFHYLKCTFCSEDWEEWPPDRPGRWKHQVWSFMSDISKLWIGMNDIFSMYMLLRRMNKYWTSHEFQREIFLLVIPLYKKAPILVQGLCLIDWGRSIDTALFPEGMKFIGDSNTVAFRCIEMLEKRPWTFQVALWICFMCLWRPQSSI